LWACRLSFGSTALERQSKAEADQQNARTPVLETSPGWTAGDPSGGAAASKRDRQVCWNSCDLKEQTQYEHLLPRLTAHRVDKLRQEREEEQQEFRIQ
jgi:hypothetical protein